MNRKLILCMLNSHKSLIASGIIWLFYVSAMIGISIGYQEWFVVKTPFTLLLAFGLLIWTFPIQSVSKWLLVALFFTGGMLLEWVGVHQQFPFGIYQYGANLGPRIDGIPWFIGVNWAVLTFITGAIANRAANLHWILRALIGAALMVFLDVFIEVPAPVFDFWTFEGGIAPLQNYLGWFGYAFLFHLVFQGAKIKGDFTFSLQLFIAQLVFFGYFFIMLKYF